MRLRPSKKKVYDNYLIYLINSDIVQKQFKVITKGTTRARVNLTIVRDIRIPLPPIPEQYRIVDKIEELFSDLDKGIESLKAVQQQLKVYRQAVLKWAFEGKLTNKGLKDGTLPKGWKYVKVSSLGAVETGTTPSKSNPKFYGNDFPFYKPTDLEAGYNVRKANDNLSKLGIKQSRYLPVNSILVTCIGATIGKTGIIRREGASNQQINAIVPEQNLNPNFIYYQAIAPCFQEAIKDNASATTLPILNKTKFANLEMVTCTMAEQNQIVQEIESRLSVCNKIEETIKETLKQSETLRQSILKKAFEGKLAPQDPNDEPASKLLERIKTEQGKDKPEKKIKRNNNKVNI